MIHICIRLLAVLHGAGPVHEMGDVIITWPEQVCECSRSDASRLWDSGCSLRLQQLEDSLRGSSLASCLQTETANLPQQDRIVKIAVFPYSNAATN
jgi:hypothetical protein